ncbi:MAG: ATP-dependent DNA helicase RecQ [Bacteroidia bacterium]
MNTPNDILKQYFGYDEFRPLQKDIVESVLAGNDTIALLPTGGGKSVCFQVPALMKPGMCIVVTPLIALMKDQVENLLSRDIPALALFSGMSRKELEFELENCVNGKYKFLYVSPERLLSQHFLDFAIHMNLNFLAIDEAHCVSQWGYDFRPPYLKIPEFKYKFHGINCIALTASATPSVVLDLEDKLELKKPKLFQASFARSNLSYVVQNEENKIEKVKVICEKIKGSGLIYVKSRKKTLEISKYLQSNGISSDYYHAGLESKLRTQKQNRWKQGEIRVMVCTNAFGMGIDKPDVRFVIHEQKPDSLEAYYQEAGRAGRDGKKSYCILLNHKSDFNDDIKRIELKYPSSKDIYRIYELIYNYLKIAVGSGKGISYNFDIQEMSSYFNVNPNLVLNALKILELDGYFQTTDSVYLPSRLKILCTYQELYEWQLNNESVDALFKTLLRSYGGLFDFYTSIFEFEIAKRINKSERWVREHLEKLKQVEIVDYIPQSGAPQIHCLEHRMSSIHISDNRISYLRNLYKEKIDAVNAYVLNTKECRSMNLVKYFGENNSLECGICDICLQKNKSTLTFEKNNERIQSLKAIINKGTFKLIDIKQHVSDEETKDYLAILRWFIDNEYLEETEDGFLKWTKKRH